MTEPVDLANLRDITGGDSDIERELFRIFCETAEDCLRQLAANMMPDKSQTWSRQAHAFKGISYNLGASVLGDLCREAQEADKESLEVKQTHLDKIKQEYAKVLVFLRNERSPQS